MNYVKCQKTTIELSDADVRQIIAEHLDVPSFQVSLEFPTLANTLHWAGNIRVVIDHNLKINAPPRD